jgi:hypothetical protein
MPRGRRCTPDLDPEMRRLPCHSIRSAAPSFRSSTRNDFASDGGARPRATAGRRGLGTDPRPATLHDAYRTLSRSSQAAQPRARRPDKTAQRNSPTPRKPAYTGPARGIIIRVSFESPLRDDADDQRRVVARKCGEERGARVLARFAVAGRLGRRCRNTIALCPVRRSIGCDRRRMRGGSAWLSRSAKAGEPDRRRPPTLAMQTSRCREQLRRRQDRNQAAVYARVTPSS